MRPAVTAAALVAMSVLAACGGHEPSGGSPSLSSRELQWVQAWGVWAKAVSRASFEAHRAFNDLEAADHDARLRATLPALRSCGRFERRLGEPTAGRFRPAYRVSADVCARL